jgi:hypothetical protein
MRRIHSDGHLSTQRQHGGDGNHQQNQQQHFKVRRWEKVRYLNVNDKLADKDGKLFRA